jgi:hypothetical protein
MVCQTTSPANSYQRFERLQSEGLLNPKDESIMTLQNAGNYLSLTMV